MVAEINHVVRRGFKERARKPTLLGKVCLKQLQKEENGKLALMSNSEK